MKSIADIDEKIIAYTAGFLDGDGHFYRPLTINGRGEKHYYARIVANQAFKHKGEKTFILEWLKCQFGGSVWYSSTGYGSWRLQGKRAVELARRLEPYLIVKRKQVRRLFIS